jgi:adenylate cyclase
MARTTSCASRAPAAHAFRSGAAAVLLLRFLRRTIWPAGREAYSGDSGSTEVHQREVQQAEVQQALIERLLRLGAGIEEIDAAAERGGVPALTIELLLAPDRHLTISEVAERAGMPVDAALRLWRAWGFSDPKPDDRRFKDVDVEMVRTAAVIEALFGTEASFHTARVMGMAISRIAESEVAMMRSALEAPLRATGASDDDVLAGYEVTIGDMIATADAAISSLHRHHLVETVRRQMEWGVEATAANVLDTVVAFADLTGSTRLASELALDELDHALSVFEERTADSIARAGATLVKRIGDAVMFATPDAGVAAEIAAELVKSFARDPVVPPVRVGVGAGLVVARRGDFYGLPVVLASRLISVARPSSVLLSEEVARRLHEAREDWETRPSGEYSLPGFAAPVHVRELILQ